MNPEAPAFVEALRPSEDMTAPEIELTDRDRKYLIGTGCACLFLLIAGMAGSYITDKARRRFLI